MSKVVQVRPYQYNTLLGDILPFGADVQVLSPHDLGIMVQKACWRQWVDVPIAKSSREPGCGA